MTGTRFKPYPETKDSGIEWLGQIPTHWEARRLKLLATINDEALGEETDPEHEIAYVDIGNVDATRGILEKESYSFVDAPSRARRIVRDGDVIVSTVRTYLRAIAPITDPEPNLVVSTGFAVIRPRSGLGTGYASYVLRAPYFVDRVVAESVGVSYPAINAWQLGTFEVAVPDVDEQQTIADFLDRETAKIDALVEKKERLIELLQEKRTALITHAVTKGLDPDVPMRDSGIEWLGQIPAHWEHTAIRYACSLVRDGTHQPPSRVVEGYRLLSVRNIIDGAFAFRDDDSRISEEDFQALQRSFAVHQRDVLLAIVGATLGKTAIVGALPEPFAIQRSLAVLRTRDQILCVSYLRYVVASSRFQQLLWANAGYSAQPGLYLNTLGAFRVPLPETEEQQVIVGFLDRETAKIDALIAKVREAIERLKEYRTALISAAVTGKIDVREEMEIQASQEV